MFLKNPKLLWKSNSFKIISIYALIFILSSFLINIYVYKIITNYILVQSRQEIAEDLKEYLTLYKKSGLASLINDISEDSTDTYFIRLIGTNGKVLVTTFPNNFKDLKKDTANENKDRHVNEWISLSGIGGYPEFEYITYTIDKSLELQIGQNIKKREDLLISIRNAYGFFILPVVILAYIGGIYLADRALNPILQIFKTLNAVVNSSNLNVRVPVQEGDELNKELIILFNNMLDKIQILMNGMREILDNVGHDLRTPLTRLRVKAETAMDSSANVSSPKK